MPRPTNAAEVRAFLANRIAERPTNDVPAVAVDGAVATIRIYDRIDDYGGWWGMSAAEVAEVVDGLPSTVTEIRLLINSPGGDVFDAVAILNILSAHPARIVAVVQGLAASAASFIAASADETIMAPGALMMIHDAAGGIWGWADDMRQMADLLDKVSDNVAGIYARKAGGEASTWRQKMRAETWFTADEAVAEGLADSVATTTEDAPIDADPPEEEPPPFPLENRLIVGYAPVEAMQALEDFLASRGLTANEIAASDGADDDPAGDVDLSMNRLAAARLALLSV